MPQGERLPEAWKAELGPDWAQVWHTWRHTLQAAWALHPERFVHGSPKPAPLPEAVWINPPATSTTGETSQ